jgi:hypothetical protein
MAQPPSYQAQQETEKKKKTVEEPKLLDLECILFLAFPMIA